MDVPKLKTAGLAVNWGPPKDTIAALNSLASMTPPPDLLICVDNGSSADQVAQLRVGAPRRTVIIELPENFGFPAATNAGMEYVLDHDVDWTLFLNNDATVEADCLNRCMAEAIAADRIAVVGPAVTFADRPDVLWFAGGEVSDWFAFTRHRGLGRPTSALPCSSDTGFVSACCALVSSAAWRSVGPYRADYFIYYEDAEWCQRARAAGWGCRYLGEILCAHAVSSTMVRRGSLGLSENAAYYLARNPLRFALESKHLGHRITRVAGLLTVWSAYNALRILRSRRPVVARAYAQGIADAVRGRMGRRPS